MSYEEEPVDDKPHHVLQATMEDSIRKLTMWEAYQPSEFSRFRRVPGGMLITEKTKEVIKHIPTTSWVGTAATAVAMTTTFVAVPDSYFYDMWPEYDKT